MSAIDVITAAKTPASQLLTYSLTLTDNTARLAKFFEAIGYKEQQRAR